MIKKQRYKQIVAAMIAEYYYDHNNDSVDDMRYHFRSNVGLSDDEMEELGINYDLQVIEEDACNA